MTTIPKHQPALPGDWRTAARTSEISEQAPLGLCIDDREIGLYQLGNSYYALENVCPHAYALLSQGFVDGEEIECPLHGARYHIPSGKCTREPGERDLKCYAVRTEGDAVLVKLD